jgi:NADH:ubiquinone oxidoreductase subunit F (NADH-binding)/NADH:ubiquinone oxidoreductase subunit E
LILTSLSTGEFRILPELRRIQDKHGYLDRHELERFSRNAAIPLSRLQAVASFFPHFRLTPAPALTVRVCRDLACHLAGAAPLLHELGSMEGKEVRVEGVSCLGRCDRAPAVCITAGHAHESYYLGRNAGELQGIVRDCVDGKALPADADHDSGRLAYPSTCWMIDPYAERSREYAAVKKFAAARNEELRREREARRDAKGEAGLGYIDIIFTELEDAGLRGMGGAGQPAQEKWRDVRDAVAEARRRGNDDRAFIVVNGDESEPGTFKDRELLLRFPHLVVEGAILAGLVTDATEGFIYIRHEFPEQIAACEAEIRRAESQGVCGAVAPVLGRPFPLSVFVSPGGYICGEQSALIEAMSGRRGEPRNLPPKLETNGLDDQPTLVSNVETMAWVPYILMNGGKKYASLGVNGWKGRRFFSVCGDVERRGVYEVPMGLTLRELVFGDQYCQGIAGGRKLKAIAPSGPSGGFLPARLADPGGRPRNGRSEKAWQELACRRGFDPLAEDLDILDLELELDLFRALSPTQMLGAGLVVYAEGRDMAEQAVNALEFYRNESCGKCAPCRVGSQKLANLGTNLLAGRIDDAKWSGELLPLVQELGEVVGLSSICGLGRSLPMPLGTVIEYFSGDLAGHLAGHGAKGEAVR